MQRGRHNRLRFVAPPRAPQLDPAVLETLLAAVHPRCGRDFTAAWRAAPHDVVVRCAVEQRVEGFLARAVAAESSTEPSVVGALRARCHTATRHHLGVVGALRRLCSALEEVGVASVVVKGPVLQERAWGAVVRPYDDLDVVVAAADVGAALATVEAVGGSVVDRNWDLLRRRHLGAVHCMLPGGIPLDLHWHLVNDGDARRHFRIDMAAIAARSEPFPPGGPDALTPTVEDALLHVALHAAVSGGHRLVWLVDVRQVVAAAPIDWDVVVTRARAWRIGLPVAAMLARSAATVGAAVPEVVVDALVPDTQRPLVRRLARWTPSGHLPGGGSIDRAVTRSLRAGVPSTLVAVAGATTAMLRRTVDPHPHWLDPRDARHVCFPSGGSSGRARYVLATMTADRHGRAGPGRTDVSHA